jgi:hypothetical protein
VKGGNRASEAGSAAGGRRGKARGKRTNKAVTAERARRGRRQGSNATGSSFSSSSSVDFGNGAGMDLDFDGVDFSGLDLGLTGNDDSGGMVPASMSMPPAPGTGYAPVNGGGQDDFFGGQGFELAGAAAGISPQQQPQGFTTFPGLDVDGAQGLGFDHQQQQRQAQMPLYMDGSGGADMGMDMNMGMNMNMDDLNMDVSSIDMEALLGGEPLAKVDTCQTVEGGGQQGHVHGKGAGQREGLSFMSEEDIRALEGWTGGLQQ